jgi:hypothetical protein
MLITAALSKIQVFLDVKLCGWIIAPAVSTDRTAFIFRAWQFWCWIEKSGRQMAYLNIRPRRSRQRDLSKRQELQFQQNSLTSQKTWMLKTSRFLVCLIIRTNPCVQTPAMKPSVKLFIPKADTINNIKVRYCASRYSVEGHCNYNRGNWKLYVASSRGLFSKIMNAKLIQMICVPPSKKAPNMGCVH